MIKVFFNRRQAKMDVKVASRKQISLASLCALVFAWLTANIVYAETYQQAKELYSSGQEQQAVDIWKELADQGDIEAQFALGAIYTNGSQLIPANKSESIKWFRMAAEGGHTISQYNLGNAYERGHGVEKSDQQAVVWWQKAAEKGHSPAQFNLGTHYVFGRGVKQDIQQAETLWRDAALQGHTAAQFNLATLYKFGPTEFQNPAKAVHWYRVAARNGHEGAKKQLSDISNADFSDDTANTNKTEEPVTKEDASSSVKSDTKDSPKEAQIAAAAKPSVETKDVQSVSKKTDKTEKSQPKEAQIAIAPITQTENKDNKLEKKETEKAQNNPPKEPQVAAVKTTTAENKVAQSVTHETDKIQNNPPKPPQTPKQEINIVAQPSSNARINLSRENLSNTVQSDATKPIRSIKIEPKTISGTNKTVVQKTPIKKQPQKQPQKQPKQQPQEKISQAPYILHFAQSHNLIRSQNPDFYTLQIAAFRDEQRVINFLKQHNIADRVAFFKFKRDNQQWYAILYGVYTSSNQAKSQISSLPKALQKPQPWIRRFSSVQKIISD